MRNRSAFTSPSLLNRFTISAQSPHKCFAIASQINRNRFTIAAELLLHCLAMASQMLRNLCVIAALSLRHRRAIALPSIRDQSAITSQSKRNPCTIAVFISAPLQYHFITHFLIHFITTLQPTLIRARHGQCVGELHVQRRPQRSQRPVRDPRSLSCILHQGGQTSGECCYTILLPPSHFCVPREFVKVPLKGAQEPLGIDPRTSKDLPGSL
jgi:hypothetical protein